MRLIQLQFIYNAIRFVDWRVVFGNTKCCAVMSSRKQERAAHNVTARLGEEKDGQSCLRAAQSATANDGSGSNSRHPDEGPLVAGAGFHGQIMAELDVPRNSISIYSVL